MLKTRNYSKGKQILTVKDLKEATSTLFLSYKNSNGDCFYINNPVNNQFSKIGEDDMIQFWLDKSLQLYDIYERLIEDREIVFSDKIDNMLDDMLSSFALEYADNEYPEAELMEKFLKELKENFRIEVRDE